MDLTDAHVLITGASRGIGAGLAEEFTHAGSRVTLIARSEGELAQRAGRLERAAYMTADLATGAGRRGLIARVEEAHGQVDVLVNNAAVAGAGPLIERDPEELERLAQLNLIAPMELSRQAVPGMIERKRGHIVNVSSLAGTAVFPGMVPYSATKAGLTHFTAGLRADLRGLPVGTTVVEIGLIPDTGMGADVTTFRPTDRSFKRFYRLGLLRDVRLDEVCRATVAAVANNRRHVRYPRRARIFPALVETPRRITEAVLSGVRSRES